MGREKTQFKKGVSGNPEGARRHNPERRALKSLTLEVYGKLIRTALEGTVVDLQAIIKDPNSSVIEIGVATSLANAMKKGDHTVFETFAARIVGKIPEVIRMESNNINQNVAIDESKLKAALDKFYREL